MLNDLYEEILADWCSFEASAQEDENKCLSNEWGGFSVGTPIADIKEWFEMNYGVPVEKLENGTLTREDVHPPQLIDNWREYKALPVDTDQQIEKEWNGFFAGTQCSVIESWFQRNYGVSLDKLNEIPLCQETTSTSATTSDDEYNELEELTVDAYLYITKRPGESDEDAVARLHEVMDSQLCGLADHKIEYQTFGIVY